MTSRDSIDVREVIFINERCRLDYEEMPEDVREAADQAIDALQNSKALPAKMLRSLRGSLAGLVELRLAYDDANYRVYVSLECLWTMMVIDAGIKKSTEGANIPKWQRERLKARHKTAREYCAAYDCELKAEYDKRKHRRETRAKELSQ